MYLLDTNVIWAFRNREPEHGDGPLFEWAANQMPSALFASALSLIEFENGARQLERKDKAGAAGIRNWVETRFRPAFDGRIISIDEPVLRSWSQLGYSDFRDGILAATALQHGLVLATDTVQNFRSGRVKTVNPWAYASDVDDLDWRRASRSAPIWLKSLFVRA